ncbi:MAG TPA: acetyltransferase [Candidatus Eremiobacteraeota bacterium]|nr:acetyltransferase [Candidatus Eremiobacteraeota bacterium]
MKKIILIGGGGHCKVVINTIRLVNQYEITGIIEVKEKIGNTIAGIPVIGSDSDLIKYINKGIKLCFITVGSTGSPSLRIKLYNNAKKTGMIFPNIIHPRSIISDSVDMGEGNFIGPGVIINPDAKVGNGCIINTGAIIEHDCKINDFVHIAPGVTLSGGVEIGKNSHIGTGTSIIQYLKIGENTIIGAGSTVVKNIGDNMIAYGNPCKKIREKDE